uniref:Uncharacterized protein n=1 Tax=Aegilops tauschii subsp. strangulata TaxID=200361 RepID=A0A453FYK8_AEGTS
MALRRTGRGALVTTFAGEPSGRLFCLRATTTAAVVISVGCCGVVGCKQVGM